MTDLTFSASGTSLYEECLRKFALRYICNIQSDTTASQALGKDVDDNKLQPYLRDGQPIETESIAGQIAEAGRHLLPPPKYPGMEVQKHFLMPAPGGQFQWQGFIDLWTPNGGLPDFESLQGTPVVVDFKTTKNWNWIKDAEQLAVDPQAQLYATWAMWATGKREVDLVWTYFRTTPPYKARRSHLRVNGEHVATQFRRLNAIGAKMLELRKAGKGLEGQAALDFALSLPPSTDACNNFGGCPHRHLCNLSPADFIDGELISANRRLPLVPSQETIDLFANLAVKAGVTPEPEPVVVASVGINPPEKALPPAPAVGDTTEAVTPPAEKAKRGRKPKAAAASPTPEEKTGEELTAEMEANARPKVVADISCGVTGMTAEEGFACVPSVDFDVAWAELGSAMKRFLIVAGSK